MLTGIDDSEKAHPNKMTRIKLPTPFEAIAIQLRDSVSRIRPEH
jgi:hypothetical protein